MGEMPAARRKRLIAEWGVSDIEMRDVISECWIWLKKQFRMDVMLRLLVNGGWVNYHVLLKLEDVSLEEIPANKSWANMPVTDLWLKQRKLMIKSRVQFWKA